MQPQWRFFYIHNYTFFVREWGGSASD